MTSMDVLSLFEIATRVFVRHVDLLRAYTEAIPAALYESLLKASLKTEQSLSTRHLFSSWPFRKLSLVNCSEFTKEFAIVLVHCLEEGGAKLREVDITGCDIGVQGTTSLLNLAAGISNFVKHCPDTDPNHMFDDKRAKHLSYRLSITADFSVSDDNYHLFRDVVSVACTSHDITVSYLRPISLSHTRIEKLSRKLWLHYQAESVIGIDLKSNRLLTSGYVIDYKFLDTFPNLKYLNLSDNTLLIKTVHHILKCISAPLTHLILNDCAISSESGRELFDEIANFPSVQKLVHLEIEDNELSIHGDLMALLIKCQETLCFLSLKGNELKDSCVGYIVQLLEPPFALETLLISDNEFSLESQKLLYKKDTMGRIKDHSLEVVVESE